MLPVHLLLLLLLAAAVAVHVVGYQERFSDRAPAESMQLHTDNAELKRDERKARQSKNNTMKKKTMRPMEQKTVKKQAAMRRIPWARGKEKSLDRESMKQRKQMLDQKIEHSHTNQ